MQDALALAASLEAELGLKITVVNARFVKPLDRELLAAHARSHALIVTMEDHVVHGGFGSAVTEALRDANLSTPVEVIAWPDRFIEHGSSVEVLRERHGLSPEAVRSKVLARFRRRAGTVA